MVVGSVSEIIGSSVALFTEKPTPDDKFIISDRFSTHVRFMGIPVRLTYNFEKESVGCEDLTAIYDTEYR
jgi:hypothetical protein